MGGKHIKQAGLNSKKGCCLDCKGKGGVAFKGKGGLRPIKGEDGEKR